MTQQELATAMREWVDNNIIPFHEKCQCEGDNILEFKQSPEEFAAQLYQEFFQPQDTMQKQIDFLAQSLAQAVMDIKEGRLTITELMGRVNEIDAWGIQHRETHARWDPR